MTSNPEFSSKPIILLLALVFACLPGAVAGPSSASLLEYHDGPDKIVTNIHRGGILSQPSVAIPRTRTIASLQAGSGDLNGDGVVNLLDVTLVKHHLLERYTLTSEQKQAADTNSDGRIDMSDVVRMVNRSVTTEATAGLVIIDEVDGLSVSSVSGSEVKLEWTGEGPPPLDKDFIVISLTEPHIFLRRILSLEGSSQGITLQTRQASLVEAFAPAAAAHGEDAYFQADLSLSGLEPPEDAGASATQSLSIFPVVNQDKTPSGEGQFDKRVTWALVGDIYGQSGAPVHVYFPGGVSNENLIWLELTIPFEWEIDYLSRRVRYIDLAASGQLGIDLSLCADLEMAQSWSRGPFAIPGLKVEKTFPVGYVVVTIEASVDAEIEIQGQVNASGRSGVHAEATLNYHTRYENSRWQTDPLALTREIRLKPIEYSLQGDFEATVTLYPKVEIEFYKQGGPILALMPYLTLEGHGTLTPPAADYNLYTGADLLFGINFGMWENIFSVNDYYAPALSLWGPYQLASGSLLNLITIDVTPDAGAWTLSGPSGYSLSGTGDRLGNSPVVVANPGDYTLSCTNNVSGWSPPSNQTRTLQRGGSIAFNAVYSQIATAGTVAIDTTPDGGKWRLTGPTDFAAVTGTGDRVFRNVPPGIYQIACYDNLAGYRPPSAQSKTLSTGGSISFNAVWTAISKPSDDHGNDAAHATAVSTNQSISGNIESGGDIDWFRFPATSGISYTLSTSLNGLHDSYLYLYDRSGTTLLGSDDDGGSGLASRIAWTCPASGNYYAAVRAYSETQTGAYSLSIMSHTGAATLTIPLPGGVTLEMVKIPAGSFLMGSNDSSTWSWCYPCEQPVHEVTIGYDFYMGKFEVTQAQWQAVMGSNPASSYGVGPNYPVYHVSWNDCQNFVTELNKLGQGTFRLPSEAEWEYACRAGTTTRFYFGDSDGCGTGCEDCAAGVLPGNRSDYMWYCGNNSPNGTKPVGGKLPNDFGLYDMHGNMWEWCEDDWHSGYANAPDTGAPWVDSPRGSNRVFRGGRWGDYAQRCRSSFRGGGAPGYRGGGVGFRLVREAP